MKELFIRLDPEGVEEVILCTNPNTEGEVTALYIARMLKPFDVKVTRIASGLPVGGDLEYADELTLGRALEGRRELIQHRLFRAGWSAHQQKTTRQKMAEVPPLQLVAGGRASYKGGTSVLCIQRVDVLLNAFDLLQLHYKATPWMSTHFDMKLKHFPTRVHLLPRYGNLALTEALIVQEKRLRYHPAAGSGRTGQLQRWYLSSLAATGRRTRSLRLTCCSYITKPLQGVSTRISTYNRNV